MSVCVCFVCDVYLEYLNAVFVFCVCIVYKCMHVCFLCVAYLCVRISPRGFGVL